MDHLAQPIKQSRNSSRNQSIGKVLFWNETSSGLEGKSENAHFKITVYRGDIIRIQASRFEEFESDPYAVVQEPDRKSVV